MLTSISTSPKAAAKSLKLELFVLHDLAVTLILNDAVSPRPTPWHVSSLILVPFLDRYDKFFAVIGVTS